MLLKSNVNARVAEEKKSFSIPKSATKKKIKDILKIVWYFDITIIEYRPGKCTFPERISGDQGVGSPDCGSDYYITTVGFM